MSFATIKGPSAGRPGVLPMGLLALTLLSAAAPVLAAEPAAGKSAQPPAANPAEQARPVTAYDPTYSYADQIFRLADPNPAGFSFYGTGRLQLPSLRADIGSNLQIDQASRELVSIQGSFNQLLSQLNQGQSDSATSAQADALKIQLDAFLKRFEKRVRLDYEFDAAIAGFAGSPFATLRLGDKPLALGLTFGAETRGFLNAQFSEKFNQSLLTLTSQLPDVFATSGRISQISSQAGTVISQVNSLRGDINTLIASASSFAGNPSNQQLNQLVTLLGNVNNEVEALVPAARNLTGVVQTTSSGARNLVTALQTASGGGISLTAANDLHLTLGIGGSYPVFENDQFKISVGAQAKVFMLPVQVPARSLKVDSDAGLLGKLAVSEVSGLDDTQNLSATLDSFDKAVTSVNTTVDQAEKISGQVTQVQTALQQRNLSDIASLSPQLISEGQSFNTNLSNATKDVQAAAVSVSNIQRTLINQLTGVSAKGTLTTPDSAGFGLDLGVDAVLWRQLRLGLLLQNPLVLWQGTERPFEGKLVQSNGNQLSFQPSLTVDDAQAKKVNYNATVPFAVLFNAQYRFDDLLPTFPGLYATGMFEYVANDRTPALTLGVQKQWDPIGYAGLGTRVGGISSLFYIEAGLRPIQGFGLDFQLGFTPGDTGVPAPGLGWLGLGKLGLFWQF